MKVNLVGRLSKDMILYPARVLVGNKLLFVKIHQEEESCSIDVVVYGEHNEPVAGRVFNTSAPIKECDITIVRLDNRVKVIFSLNNNISQSYLFVAGRNAKIKLLTPSLEYPSLQKLTIPINYLIH